MPKQFPRTVLLESPYLTVLRFGHTWRLRASRARRAELSCRLAAWLPGYLGLPCLPCLPCLPGLPACLGCLPWLPPLAASLACLPCLPCLPACLGCLPCLLGCLGRLPACLRGFCPASGQDLFLFRGDLFERPRSSARCRISAERLLGGRVGRGGPAVVRTYILIS